VTEDVPADVRAVLAQLFADGRASLRASDRETAVETVTTAEAVATNELPEGAFRDRLLHGCEASAFSTASAAAPESPWSASRWVSERTAITFPFSLRARMVLPMLLVALASA
jgi:hypothetical protein